MLVLPATTSAVERRAFDLVIFVDVDVLSAHHFTPVPSPIVGGEFINGLRALMLHSFPGGTFGPWSVAIIGLRRERGTTALPQFWFHSPFRS